MSSSTNEIVFEVPGSKSITQRALITSALAEGRSRLSCALDSEDTRLLRQALRKFGVDIDDSKDSWEVKGTKGKIKCPEDEIFMGNNGTGIRFLMSFSALCSGSTVLTGTPRMMERPAGPLLDALKQLGVDAISLNNSGCPPVKITSNGLDGGVVKLSASISSQFLSSILLVAPYAKRPITITLDGKLVSRPYVDITLRVMEDFGIGVEEKDSKFYIPLSNYQARKYEIEADASSASYFFGAAAITSSSIRIKNLPPNPIQGDAQFCDILGQMGCKVEKGKDGTVVTGPGLDKLKGIEIDMSKWPDVVPTLAVVAAFAKGQTIIKNVEHLRVKETDRIKAVVTELNKIGCKAIELPDGMIINGNPSGLKAAEIKTYDDHRIAMCFAIAKLLIPDISFDDKEVVKKSFPDFWNYWNKLEKELKDQVTL